MQRGLPQLLLHLHLLGLPKRGLPQLLLHLCLPKRGLPQLLLHLCLRGLLQLLLRLCLRGLPLLLLQAPRWEGSGEEGEGGASVSADVRRHGRGGVQKVSAEALQAHAAAAASRTPSAPPQSVSWPPQSVSWLAQAIAPPLPPRHAKRSEARRASALRMRFELRRFGAGEAPRPPGSCGGTACPHARWPRGLCRRHARGAAAAS